MKNQLEFAAYPDQAFSYSLLRQSSYLINKVVNKIPDWKHKNILIVDQDETNACLLKNYLTKTKATLVNVPNGKKAIAICAANLQIDLVIMDVHIPEMKGFKAVKTIKSVNSRLPVIAQAQNANDREVKTAMDSGCDGFLDKPVSQEALFKVLMKYLH